ncbi:MAG: MBL fold metallo-hydrolase [Lachnospiraceae bacterium]|nr:MBL fold metallo-hydrolase [Lachnospiraceae bacterium]
MRKGLWNKLKFILMLALLVSVLCACVPGNTTATEDSDANTSTTQAPETTESGTEEPTTEEPTTEAEKELYRVNEGSPLEGIPYYDYDTYKGYWNMEKGAEMLLFTAKSSDGYTQYLTDLTDAGFSLYAENEIVGNLYSTWTKDELIVTMMHMPNLGSTRIVAEPLSNGLATLESENTYTDAGYENLIIQIGSPEEYNNGMCYVYRLCDGSFIVVDMGQKNQKLVDNIYELLEKYAPDPDNIVIAAFFVTHAHGDHYGGFETFTYNYRDNVTIEKIVYNYHNEKSFEYSDETDPSCLYIVEELAELYDGVELIEAHPGQEFFIRDARIEILYTWEMFSSDIIPYLNNSCIVFSVTLENTKIMQLGDCGPQASPILVDVYGNYLDSDFIQVAHHGNIGANAELNRIINPEVILYPANWYNYDRFYETDRNAPFRDAEHVYVAGGKATVIPLPFDSSKVEVWDIYPN